MRAKDNRGSSKTAEARRYLAQRREGGERDLVLSAPAVALGTSPQPVDAPPGDWREALRAIDAAPGDNTRAAQTRPAAAPVAAPEGAAPGAALEAPPTDVRRPQREAATSRSASGTVTKRAWHSDVTLEQLATGLTIGSSSHDMFEGGRRTFATLTELERAVASCKRCGLYRGAKNPVPGEGDPNADLMCVGEAPGATEDELGRPFVGQAGKLLTQILAAIDLPREQVYICNVLKHRPPNNRNPLPDEVTACQPYLVRQVELIRPKVILALGTFAAQTLLDTKTSMGKLREAVHTYHGIPLVVTYHPAALLRNPSWKRPTWEDVQLARRFLDRSSVPARQRGA